MRELQHALHVQPLVDGPRRYGDVLRMEDDEVPLLCDAEDELLDALDPSRRQVGGQLDVVPDGHDELGQPDVVPGKGVAVCRDERRIFWLRDGHRYVVVEGTYVCKW